MNNSKHRYLFREQYRKLSIPLALAILFTLFNAFGFSINSSYDQKFTQLVKEPLDEVTSRTSEFLEKAEKNKLLDGNTPTPTLAYCTPTWFPGARNRPAEPITLVQLGKDGVNGIDNPSSDLVSIETPKYEDFSAISMDVVKGETYTLKVKGNTDGDAINYITVYFDWNGNGVFSNGTPDDEAHEISLTNQSEKHQYLDALENSTGLDNKEVVHSVVIPTDAALGPIRMRVVKNYQSPSNDPCEDPFSFGQVEDYTLNITESVDSVDVIAVSVDTIDFAAAAITEAGGTLQLVANVTPAEANQEIIWSIASGEEFASVDQNGLVTAIANGTVEVQATSVYDPTKSDTIEVTVAMSTEYCEAYFINGCDEYVNIESVFTTGALTNINNLNSGCSDINSEKRGYSDFTSHAVTTVAGGTFDLTVVFGARQGNEDWLSVWIDWNHDFQFSDDERVYFAVNGEPDRAIFTVQVPENARLGSTRMRVKVVNGWEGSGPCGYNSYGEVEDYTVTITNDPTPEANYCIPSWTGWAVNEPTEPITLVQLGRNGVNRIDNPSSDLVSTDTPRYEDFSAISMNVIKGETYTLKVKGNTNGDNINYITVYFDWNGDGVFSNSTPDDEAAQMSLTNQSEKHQYLDPLENSTGLDELEVVHSVVIPTDAALGTIRMRVVKNYQSPSNEPCENPFLFGQVEDYTLNIVEASACPEVELLKIENIGETSATVVIGSESTTFDIEYGVTGFEQGEGTVVEGVGTPYTIENLTADVMYDVYVRTTTCTTWEKVSFKTLLVKEQTITISDVQKVYGDEPFAPGASDSNLPLTYAVANSEVAVVENGLLVIKEAGETTVTVNQAGNAEYLPAEEVSFTLQIAKAPLTVKAENKTMVYNGLTFGNWTVTYDGFVYEETQTVLTGNVSYTGSAIAAVNVGTYEVEPSGYSASNYEIEYEAGAFTIIKANLTGLVLEDASFIYDGIAKSLVVVGELPEGVTVTYEGNEKTTVGSHIVKAHVNGGVNYENLELEAIMQIREELTSIRFEDATFIYDGENKHIEATNVPEGVTVTYENNGKTEVGTYTVTAHFDGGSLFENTTRTATLTITKADLTDRLVLEDESFVHDGAAKALVISGTLPAGVTVAYAGNGQINVGTYEVTATINGGVNYNNLVLTADLTITKGTLALVLEDQTFMYDGQAKALTVTGTIPQGVTVTYTNNQQTEIGVYQVGATVNGGANYQDLSLTANLTIVEGVITNIQLNGATFVYDGIAKSLAITGELPEGFTVTYTNNGQINAGTYQVTATIIGTEFYRDLVLTANLVITKASIEGIIFEDQTFVYDGTPKSIYVSGARLPAGVTVQHLNNGKINVGVYEVEARVNGGANYSDQSLKAKLIIEKATQQITFNELTTIILSESEDFQLNATVTSGLPLSYTYTYTSAAPAAEVSATGWVTLNTVGEIAITVAQEGNSNVVAATPVTRVLRIVNNDASMHQVWIENESYENPEKEVYHLMSCEDLSTEVKVRVVIGEGASIIPSQEFTIHVPKPGVYTQKVSITSHDGKVTRDYVIKVEKPFTFQQIAVKKFNNTLLINNNSNTNGGYHFSSFQWYKDGIKVSDEQVYSAGNNSFLETNAVYHAIVTTTAGDQIHVCPMEVTEESVYQILLYPNPVVSGSITTLSVKVNDINLKGIQVQVFSATGQLVYTFTMEGETTEVRLPQTLPSGMYVAVFELNGQKKSIKFAVKK